LASDTRHRRALVAIGAAAVLAAVIVVIVLAAGSSGAPSSASTVHAAPANAPLTQQLNTLDQMVNRVSGR
jgi:hypothetical protein